ncbi:MAG: hypothetical protein RI949_2557 [Pseudomonadota bacterium]
MPDALLLLPDFLLIAAGYLICRHTTLNRPVWEGVERLVYYLLFPSLLFMSIVRNPLNLQSDVPLAAGGLAVVMTGVMLAYAIKKAPGVDGLLHASGSQTAFRFNSYVALAMADRLAGPPGVAWMALLVSVCVPVCNIAAVWPLARTGGHGYARELIRNPLILATVGGLTCNLLQVQFPELVKVTLTRAGAAALPLGLMAVGAGLRLGALNESPRMAATFLGIRHVVLPGVAMALSLALPLSGPQQLLLVAFASMPTASSAYVLAVRMGGHGPFVAGIVSVSTLVAMAGLPLSLELYRRLSSVA